MAVSKVSELRNCRFKCVDKRPGFYRWWFKKEAAQSLTKNMDKWLKDNRFLIQSFDKEEYIALYFGISKDMRGRIRWHASQKHSPSAVSKGFLSTLRQTLSALLEIQMSKSEEAINQFLDDNCVWEWSYTDTYEDAHQVELNILATKDHYYPLNLKDNHTIDKVALDWLKQQRKEYRR